LHGRVNVLVANVPYVPTADLPFLPAESRDHEPITTVDGGEDGLALLNRLAAGAGKWLAPGGRVMSEVSERQVPLAESIFAGHGLIAELRADSDLGATVVVGRFTP
jgi:release factor glutamine methyltransferase